MAEKSFVEDSVDGVAVVDAAFVLAHDARGALLAWSCWTWNGTSRAGARMVKIV